MRERRRLALVSTLGLLNASAGAALALRRGLPASWGGVLRGRDVARDFVGLKGTALSPPLALLVAQALLTGAALRPGRTGARTARGLAMHGALEGAGMLGEPILWRALRPATFDPAPAAIAAGFLALAALMMRLGAGRAHGLA